MPMADNEKKLRQGTLFITTQYGTFQEPVVSERTKGRTSADRMIRVTSQIEKDMKAAAAGERDEPVHRN